MRSYRAMKNKARRDLHRHAQVPALYISGVPGVAGRIVTVRLHTKPEDIGQLTGSKNYAEKAEIKPRIVVMRDQIMVPRNNALFSFSQGEVYRVASSEPPDGITITAVCAKLSATEAAGIPYPLVDDGESPGTSDPGDGGGTGIGESNRIVIPFPNAESNWTYQHNLGYYPEVLTLGPDGDEIEGSVQHTSVNLVTITFRPATSGTLILI